MITGMPRIAIAGEDFPGIISTFRDKLGMPVIDVSTESIKSLGAALAMCTPEGGSNIEIMSPGNPDTPLSQSIQGFLDRRGQGHFALMLEAADPDEEAEGLLARGLNVMPRMEGAGGRDIHPKSAHGVLIRVYPIDSFTAKGDKSAADQDAPGLTGIARVLIAVRDLDEAVDTYGTKFALEVSDPVQDDEKGVCRVICTPPSGGVIELVAAADIQKPFAASIERFLATRGEGMYALVLGTDDLQQTAKALASRGMGTSEIAGLENTLELDQDAMFGTRFWIE